MDARSEPRALESAPCEFKMFYITGTGQLGQVSQLRVGKPTLTVLNWQVSGSDHDITFA